MTGRGILRLAQTTVLALAFAASGFGTVQAASVDKAGRCGQLFLDQAKAAAATMPNFVRYVWVATQTTSGLIRVDLLVYGKTSAQRYTGFVCDIGAGGTMTVHKTTSSGS